MTVHRQKSDKFDISPLVVANAIQKILNQRPPYRDTTEIEAGMVFKTNVKPNWWLLGTEMIVKVQPSSGGSQVTVKIKSQRYIKGDVFNFYNRYIQNFLKDLRFTLQKQHAQIIKE